MKSLGHLPWNSRDSHKQQNDYMSRIEWYTVSPQSSQRRIQACFLLNTGSRKLANKDIWKYTFFFAKVDNDFQHHKTTATHSIPILLAKIKLFLYKHFKNCMMYILFLYSICWIVYSMTWILKCSFYSHFWPFIKMYLFILYIWGGICMCIVHLQMLVQPRRGCWVP